MNKDELIQVEEYLTDQGQCPFAEWLSALKDVTGRALLRKRINRLRRGNFGTTETLGNGLFELKIYYGPGYRVYFGRDGETIVILLCGGDKGSQKRDIERARKYWDDYRR